MTTPLLGAHVSIAGGLDKAIDNGQALGANTIQTFASSPRTLAFKPIDAAVIQQYLAKKTSSQIQLHVFHGIYLINLAHTDAELRLKAVESLVSYQQLASQINGFGTVFHTGSHKGLGLDAVIDVVVAGLKQVLELTPPNVWLMLENTAGQGGAIGQSIEQLAQIFATLEKAHVSTDQLGICLDTQHAFAAGYPIHTPQGVDQLLNQIERMLGLSKLKLLHLNDSLPEFNTKKDRHANLGEGHIGLEAFSYLVNHPQLRQLPMILEVPGNNKSGPRPEDVRQLQNLIT